MTSCNQEYIICNVLTTTKAAQEQMPHRAPTAPLNNVDAMVRHLVRNVAVIAAADAIDRPEGPAVALRLEPGFVQARAEQQGLADSSAQAAAADTRFRACCSWTSTG